MIKIIENDDDDDDDDDNERWRNRIYVRTIVVWSGTNVLNQMLHLLDCIVESKRAKTEHKLNIDRI
jgi:hypothetical protein